MVRNSPLGIGRREGNKGKGKKEIWKRKKKKIWKRENKINQQQQQHIIDSTHSTVLEDKNTAAFCIYPAVIGSKMRFIDSRVLLHS